MVTVTSIKLNAREKTAFVSLFADTKSEVTDDVEVDGIPSGYTIAMGSDVMTASADMAFMKSDGHWSWV